MNINTRPRIIAYLSVFFFLVSLLVSEYLYVEPYNGNKWLPQGLEYMSTRSFTWFFVLAGSMTLTITIIRSQKIGLLGLFLLIATVVSPYILKKFPKEQAVDFYRDRTAALNQIVKQFSNSKDTSLTNAEIEDLDFLELKVFQGTYYFLVDEVYTNGICYDKDGELPKENFGSGLKYVKLDRNWYEFDYH